MICGTPHSRSQAFVQFARVFFEALAERDYGAALARLDMRGRRWTRAELEALLARTTDGAGISSPRGMMRSASPVVESSPDGETFRLEHRLPVGGRWSNTRAVFAFHRATGDYFHVVFEGITSR